MRRYLLSNALCLPFLLFAAAHADEAHDLTPLHTSYAGIETELAGFAYVTASQAFQPGAAGLQTARFGGAATLMPSLQTGLGGETSVSLQGAFFLHSDRFSVDNYDSDFVQKVYGTLETGFGSFEIGMTDGAAFAMSLSGPVVDDEPSAESHNVTFFPNPAGGTMIDGFALNSSIETSFNFAKIAYYTPEMSGFRFGLSYAPGEGKAVLPFLESGARHANRQRNIWEFAAAYTVAIGPATAAFGAGGSLSQPVAGERTAGHTGLKEWDIGSEWTLPLSADTAIAFGGGYHASNAYGFDIAEARERGQTSSAHIGAKIDHGSWSFGAEYSDGTADGGLESPSIGVRGYGAAMGYRYNRNWSFALGWQELRYAGTETFYNGAGRIALDALFLHLHFNLQRENRAF